MADLSALPGAELVEAGLEDLAAGRETAMALLVSIASLRLRRLGLSVPRSRWDEAEHRLYRALSDMDPASAYSRYNSLLRRLNSFASTLEREQGRQMRLARGQHCRLVGRPE